MTQGLRLIAISIFLCAGSPAAAGSLLLSEAFYDAAGSDQAQLFVELYGPAGCVIDGYTIEGVNGSNGAVGPLLDLVGALPADGFFVIADLDAGATAVANVDLLLNFDFQNGPDSIVLRDAAGVVLDALGYGVFAAGEVFAGEGAAAPDAPAGSSLARRFANVDTDDNLADFVVLAAPTPGSGDLALPEPTVLILLGTCLTGLAGRLMR